MPHQHPNSEDTITTPFVEILIQTINRKLPLDIFPNC